MNEKFNPIHQCIELVFDKVAPVPKYALMAQDAWIKVRFEWLIKEKQSNYH